MSIATLVVDDPCVEWEEGTLEFRLTYEGVLLSETNRSGEVRRARADHKHEIRKKFHPQLKRLWEVHPYLRPWWGPTPQPGRHILGRPGPGYSIDDLSSRFARFGYRFVPLVTKDIELLCSIEILFLRQGDPGGILVNRSGDIDNRLKLIFDALTMPAEPNQVGRYVTPDAGEDPFFCLLESDSMITKASVETDILLEASSNPPDPNDARLLITVRLKPGRVNTYNIGWT
jgi:hypothetical protein